MSVPWFMGKCLLIMPCASVSRILCLALSLHPLRGFDSVLPLSGPLDRSLLPLGALGLPLLGSSSPHSLGSLASLLLLRSLSPSSLSFRLYLPPRRPGPLFLSPCPPCRLRVTPLRPLPCWLPVSRPTSLAVLGRLGNSSWFLEKTTGVERKALSLPGCPPPSLGPGGLSQSHAGPRQEALRFLASPRRPPDLAPAPRPTAQILFRRRSRWQREEAQAERGFQGSQAWGFLSPGSGLRPPQWGPQVAGGAGVVVGSWGEGGAIRQGVWWPPARLAWAGVTPTPGTAGWWPAMEKYSSQTWDAWTDMRTLGIRDGG